MRTITEFKKIEIESAINLLSSFKPSDSEEDRRIEIHRHFGISEEKALWLLKTIESLDRTWLPDLKRVVIAELNRGDWAPYYAIGMGSFYVLFEPISIVAAPGWPDERIPLDDPERFALAEAEWLRLWAERTGGRTPSRVI